MTKLDIFKIDVFQYHYNPDIISSYKMLNHSVFLKLSGGICVDLYELME